MEIRCAPPGAVPTAIRIGRGLRSTLLDEVPERALCIVDAAVAEAWPGMPGSPLWITHPGGEAHKTLAGLEHLLRRMAQMEIDRTGVLVAVGGGALGDLVGLAGALYLRGIEVWQVPTTLLAMVDASVGGKTAVDLPEGKNLVGAIHPPSRVLVDPEFLGTLPDREFQSGLAEALKMAIGMDAELFEHMERHAQQVLARDPSALQVAIERSLAGKARIVEDDLGETGPRRTLNLGHTVGHAIEGYAIEETSRRVSADASVTPPAHGLCVAQGLHWVLELASRRDLISDADRQRCGALLTTFGFHREPTPPWEQLLPFLRRDKKISGRVLHWVLPTGVGQCKTEALPLDALSGGMDQLAQAPAG